MKALAYILMILASAIVFADLLYRQPDAWVWNLALGSIGLVWVVMLFLEVHDETEIS